MDYFYEIGEDDDVEVAHEMRSRAEGSSLWMRRDKNPKHFNTISLYAENADIDESRNRLDEGVERRQSLVDNSELLQNKRGGEDVVKRINTIFENVLRQEKKSRELIEHKNQRKCPRPSVHDLYTRRSEDENETERENVTIPGLSDIDERCGSYPQPLPVELVKNSEPATSTWTAAIPAGLESRVNAIKPKRKKAQPRTIWVSSVSGEVALNGIMNPGPFSGKKYKKSIQAALKEGDAKVLFCPRKPKLHYDPGYDNDTWEDDIKTLSEFPVATKEYNENRDRQNDLEAATSSTSKSENSRNEEILRLLNLQIQANEKMHKLNYQLEILKNQNNVLRLNVLSRNSDRLFQNEELQEKIKRRVDKLLNTLMSVESMLEEYRKLTNEDRYSHLNPATEYQYFDSGQNLCQFCSDVLPSLSDLLDHLHLDHLEVLLTIDADNRPWAVNNSQCVKEKNKKLPFKGSEFLFPCRGFYCDICKTFMGDEVMTKAHMEGSSHNARYNNYCKNNPSIDVEKKLTINSESEIEFEEEIDSLEKLVTEESCDANSSSDIDDEIIASGSSHLLENNSQSCMTDDIQVSSVNSRDDTLKATTASHSQNDSDVILVSDSDSDDVSLSSSIDDDFLYKGDNVEMKSLEDEPL
ncbi:hypothetical protein CHUAL_012925 [Chamberlinius hualienensis]